jgi:Zn-dependent M28 family amino/carboxypeptidase
MFLYVCLLMIGNGGFAQLADPVTTLSEVERIEQTLSADDMEGRRPSTKGIEKAANFIASEFTKAGLQPVAGTSYLQEFSMLRTKLISAAGHVNGQPLIEKNITCITGKQELSVDDKSAYKKIIVQRSDNLPAVITSLQATANNHVVIVDTAHRIAFERLKGGRLVFAPKADIVCILTNERVKKYSVQFKQEVSEVPLKNVVGILPGKSKNNEYVIFSGHYDHLGIGKPNATDDSIFNGANDDAAGITAVIMLAHHFAQQKNNERTLIFAAFTAEESGGFGSQYFSRQYDPKQVMAMFNIEMIGTESKWGKNSAFITGYEKSDMGKILENNLQGTGFIFYPDPYPQQQLFYRSDNATLARLGVPAHTISTSKMDSEPYYHTQEDEIETLDLNNMTEIIKAIAISSTSIVTGKDTPSRVDTSQLKGN